MEPSTIIQIVGTGVVSAALSGWLSHFLTEKRDAKKERSTQEREGRYLAIRIAVALEQFTFECADRVAENENNDSPDGHLYKRYAAFPKIAEFPTDADWKALSPSLLNDCLVFRASIAIPERSISFIFDVADAEDAASEFNVHARKYAVRAWELAAELRRTYQLPAADPAPIRWNFVDFLRGSTGELRATK
jgi:hypothetical protein